MRPDIMMNRPTSRRSKKARNNNSTHLKLPQLKIVTAIRIKVYREAYHKTILDLTKNTSMSRGPPKKRSSIFLDDSDSDSESSASYKDNSISEDESFNDAEEDKSDDFYYASDDQLITQPVRRSTLRNTPDKSNEAKPKASRDVSASVKMDSLAMITDDGTTDAMATTPKASTNALASTANIVTNPKSSDLYDTQQVEILDPAQEESRKPSKLRLKLKMKGRAGASKQHENEEETSQESETVDAKPTELINDSNSNGHTKERKKEKKSLVYEVVDLCADDDKPISKKAKTKKSSPIKPATISKSKSKTEVQAQAEGKAKKSSPVKSAVIATTTATSAPSTGVKRKRKVGKQHNVAAGEASASASPEKPLKNTASAQTKPQQSASDSTTAPSLPKPIPKKKKRTFQDQVLLHMMTSIKPYTLKGLASELRTTDVALQHLMLSLTDKGIVQRKEFGKKVKKELFWVDLEKATTEIYKDKVPTMEDMQNAKLEQRRVSEEEIMQIQILKGMESDFTNDELSKRLEDEEKTAGDLRARVQEAKDRIAGKTIGSQGGPAGPGGLHQSRLARFSAPPKKPKTRKQLNKEFNYMRSEWKSRKEKCMDFIDNLSDAMEKHPKEAVKMLELETDENSGGVKIPPKRDLDV